MKTWVEFKERNLSGNLVTPCGSDAYCFLDGRNNLHNMVNDSLLILSKKLVDYPAFEILQGNRLSKPLKTLYTYEREELI